MCPQYDFGIQTAVGSITHNPFFRIQVFRRPKVPTCPRVDSASDSRRRLVLLLFALGLEWNSGEVTKNVVGCHGVMVPIKHKRGRGEEVQRVFTGNLVLLYWPAWKEEAAEGPFVGAAPSPPLCLDAFETGREGMWPPAPSHEWLHVHPVVVFFFVKHEVVFNPACPEQPRRPAATGINNNIGGDCRSARETS